jgi:predicted DNA-binding antitoxin AbrB/MazE fold protein
MPKYVTSLYEDGIMKPTKNFKNGDGKRKISAGG